MKVETRDCPEWESGRPERLSSVGTYRVKVRQSGVVVGTFRWKRNRDRPEWESGRPERPEFSLHPDSSWGLDGLTIIIYG